MSTVYVDTSALLPLLDADDTDHQAVVTALRRLEAERAALATTSYTLVEAGALVRSRLGLRAFGILGETAERAIDVVWVDRGLHREAWSHAAREPRRGPSLVDWVSFLAMRANGWTRALAVDRHFSDQGFETLP